MSIITQTFSRTIYPSGVYAEGDLSLVKNVPVTDPVKNYWERQYKFDAETSGTATLNISLDIPSNAEIQSVSVSQGRSINGGFTSWAGVGYTLPDYGNVYANDANVLAYLTSGTIPSTLQVRAIIQYSSHTVDRIEYNSSPDWALGGYRALLDRVNFAVEVTYEEAEEQATVSYGVNNAYQKCNVFYGAGGEWKKCKAYFGSGGSWVECK